MWCFKLRGDQPASFSQIPIQPLRHPDRPPVYDQRCGRAAAAASVHRHGRTTQRRPLLGKNMFACTLHTDKYRQTAFQRNHSLCCHHMDFIYCHVGQTVCDSNFPSLLSICPLDQPWPADLLIGRVPVARLPLLPPQATCEREGGQRQAGGWSGDAGTKPQRGQRPQTPQQRRRYCGGLDNTINQRMVGFILYVPSELAPASAHDISSSHPWCCRCGSQWTTPINIKTRPRFFFFCLWFQEYYHHMLSFIYFSLASRAKTLYFKAIDLTYAQARMKTCCSGFRCYGTWNTDRFQRLLITC